jgi:hypothetical protein
MKKILLISLILIGCGTPKQNQRKAVKHYEKAVKFGLVINPIEPSKPDAFITDTIVDSKGNVFLTKRPIFYNCPACNEVVFPKSNVQIRQEERTKRKQDTNDRKEHNSDNKAETKKNKSDNKLKKVETRQEEKTERKWAKWVNGLMVGLAIGIIATILVSWWIGAYRRKDKNSNDRVERWKELDLDSFSEKLKKW